jgi:hypothetical protein
MIYRKKINQLSALELKDLPFYIWQCVTLNIKGKELNLVIKDQQVMDWFLMLLIQKIDTIDGIKGSANKLREMMMKKESKK